MSSATRGREREREGRTVEAGDDVERDRHRLAHAQLLDVGQQPLARSSEGRQEAPVERLEPQLAARRRALLRRPQLLDDPARLAAPSRPNVHLEAIPQDRRAHLLEALRRALQREERVALRGRRTAPERDVRRREVREDGDEELGRERVEAGRRVRGLLHGGRERSGGCWLWRKAGRGRGVDGQVCAARGTLLEASRPTHLKSERSEPGV